ncbi:DUF2860 family protein [Marinomonas sp. MED121]|uniref:DUF2860 family protein n=1 Tax=Marinomonas sp. MED121 TaxID=314277 RepID=UPI0002E2CE99|nr:DUF2860 family protein [Marinomonas sp. MED121]
MKNYLIPLVCLPLTNLAYAGPGDDPFEEQGFSGSISLFAGFSSGKSNLDTETKTKTGSLNTEGSSESDVMALPLGDINYTFGKQKVFLAIGESDAVGASLELGYGFQLADQSALMFSYLLPVIDGEAWADPYLVNTARTETDVATNGYRLQYLNMLNIGLDADLVYYDTDVDNELSASTYSANTQSLLKRDGDGIYASLSTGLPISQTTFLMPSIHLDQFSADGDAMSYTAYGVGLMLMNKFGEHAVSLGYDYSSAEYDKTNPIFNQTQEDTSSSISLGYSKENLMGYQNLELRVMLSYDEVDSNIDFYNESGYMIGVGTSYAF